MEHLRTAARSRGLCTDGGMALLIRVLEMDDAMKNRNLDSQAGPYTSGSGYIFSSTTDKVLHHNMSETELRSKCINLQVPYNYGAQQRYAGTKPGTAHACMTSHFKAMQMKVHKKPMHLPSALCAWSILEQTRLLYLLAVDRVGALHACRQF